MDEHKDCKETEDKLWGKIARLECQVERLREGLLVLIADEHGALSNAGAEHVNQMLNETPAQCLNAVRADAVEEALDSDDVAWFSNRTTASISDLRNYAKKLRGES